MPCYRPLEGYQAQPGAPLLFGGKYSGHELRLVACGQCIGCKLEYSRQWAVRIMHEARMHDWSSFITLTFAGELSIAQRSLRYEDYQEFQNRLRAWERRRSRREKRERLKLPYFVAGEYGDDNQRPHFHSVVFGLRFPDMVHLRKSPSGESLYRSETLERLWPHGYSSIGSVTFESAAYVARYTVKKISGVRYVTGWHPYTRADQDTGEIFEVEPEFAHMSLKPGIGATWLDRYWADVYPEGKVVSRGRLANAPTYYNERRRKVAPEEIEDLQLQKLQEGKARFADSSDERLSVREQVARARSQLHRRKL